MKLEPKHLEDARRRAKLVADAIGFPPTMAPVDTNTVSNKQTLQTIMQESFLQPLKKSIDNLNETFKILLGETNRSNKRQP